MAPYCALTRDYLSDTTHIACYWGFRCLNMANWVRYPPPFSERFPLKSMRSGGAIPSPQKGYLSDTCAITYENKAKACDTPVCVGLKKHTRKQGVFDGPPQLTDLFSRVLFSFCPFCWPPLFLLFSPLEKCSIL